MMSTRLRRLMKGRKDTIKIELVPGQDNEPYTTGDQINGIAWVKNSHTLMPGTVEISLRGKGAPSS